MEKHVHHERGESPVVIINHHSGRPTDEVLDGLPDFVKEVVRFDDEKTIKTIRGGVDVAVNKMTGLHDQKDHTIISTEIPRAIIDLNRTLEEVDELSVEGRGKPGHANGLIWRSCPLVADSVLGVIRSSFFPGESKSMLNRPYTEGEFQELLDFAYHPFNQAIYDAAQETVDRCGHAILVAPHSFPAHIGTKVLRGDHNGAYIFGPPAQKSTRMASNTREFLADMLLRKKLPNLIKLTHSDICSPIISKIVDEEFEKEGNISIDGYFPFEVRPGDAEYEYGNTKNNIHFIAFEQIAHDELEPGRTHGSLEVNSELAAEFRPIYQKIFDRLASLKTEDLTI